MWWLVAAVVAGAGEADGELSRLQHELTTLARKNAWSGVERTFVAMEALSLPLTLDDRVLGALAARHQGNMLTALDRLQKAVQQAPDQADTTAWQDAQAAIDDLKSRYGFVHVVIYETGKKFPNVERPEMPFGPEDQRAIAWAQDRLATSRSYTGLLPHGHYRLGDQDFDVVPITANVPMLELRVGTPPAGSARL